MKIVALETIKYGGKNRVPGTDSAVFECKQDIAKDLIKNKKAILPQTLEQANKPVHQQKADELIAEAEKKAAEIIEAAEDRAAEMIKEAEAKVAEIIDQAQDNLEDLDK